MENFLQSLVSGLLIGGIYGLTAVGLTLIFGVMKVINFAHGSLLMVGMFAAYWFVKLSGLNPYLALFVVVPLLFLFGYAMQHVVIRPVFKAEKDVREPITVIIVTTGIWYILDNLSLMAFGAEYRVVHTSVSGKIFDLGGIYFLQSKLYGFLIALATTLFLYWFLKHSRMGKAIRATSLDREAASLMGVNQYRIYNIAFGIGTACCGVAGCVLIPFYYVYPTVGTIFDIRAFIIVVLGGLGSIPGALLGGSIGTFDDLFDTVAAGNGARPLATDAQRALVLRGVVSGAALGPLGVSARFGGFADSLGTAIAELEAGLLEPADVDGDLAALYAVDEETGEARELLAAGGFTVLNHHAAQMDVRVSVADPAFDARTNLLGLLNLLEGARAGGVTRVVFASSGGVVYDDRGTLPHVETGPKLPLSPYGVSKLGSEYYLAAYARLYGLATVALRYANVYGPRQNAHGEAGGGGWRLRGQQPSVFGGDPRGGAPPSQPGAAFVLGRTRADMLRLP